MSHAFTIAVTPKASGETQTQSGTFSDADWSVLCEFADEAERLLAWTSGDSRVNYSLRWSVDSGIEHHWRVPDPERIDSLLHRLRPFVLNTERCFFPRTCNILCRTITLPGFRKGVEMLRRQFLDDDFQSQAVLSANGVVLNSEDVLRLWLNGFEYHRDEDKQASLQALAQIIPLEAQRAIFISMMLDKARAVLALARVIFGFKARNGFTHTLRGDDTRNVKGSIGLIEPVS